MFFSWIERYHISDARSRFRPRDNIEPAKREPRRAPQGFNLPALGWKVYDKSFKKSSKYLLTFVQIPSKIRPKSIQNHPKSIQNRCLLRACQNGCQKLPFWKDFGIHFGSLFAPFSLKNQKTNPKGAQMASKIRKKASKKGYQKTMPKIT